MALTLIEWTALRLLCGKVIPGYTFNPWLGCSKVSDACKFCYIVRTTPFRVRGLKHGDPRERTSKGTWELPIKWNADAAKLPFICEQTGIRLASDDDEDITGEYKAIRYSPRVFCASLADWLDDEVQAAWLGDLLELIANTKNLTWMLLTKRAELWKSNLEAVLDYWHLDVGTAGWNLIENWLDEKPPTNVQFGITVENQARADDYREILKGIPAAAKFVSYEPALSDVNWTGWDFINGLICGGESGAKEDAVRPMDPQWARNARDWCASAKVPFFFKQWGDYCPLLQIDGTGAEAREKSYKIMPRGFPMFRVGKSAAGRLLDGREHNELPQFGRQRPAGAEVVS